MPCIRARDGDRFKCLVFGQEMATGSNYSLPQLTTPPCTFCCHQGGWSGIEGMQIAIIILYNQVNLK